MWRYSVVEEIDKKARTIPGQPRQKKSSVKQTVGPCDKCDVREVLGCGWLGLKSAAKFVHVDESFDLVGATCPEYYACQPSVGEAYEHLADYKRGALGNVANISAPLLEALRILEAEQGALQDSFD